MKMLRIFPSVKSLKMPKGQSEAVIGGRTDSTLAKITHKFSVHVSLPRLCKNLKWSPLN